MKIVEIKILRGPNYWSIRRPKLIQMKLDLEEMEQKPSNEMPGFKEKLEKLLPGLYVHRCSEGVHGGFLSRVEDGTWMGHIIEHVALELQTLAGMDMGFGRTRTTGKDGEYFVVFDYMEEEAGVYAAYRFHFISFSDQHSCIFSQSNPKALRVGCDRLHQPSKASTFFKMTVEYYIIHETQASCNFYFSF